MKREIIDWAEEYNLKREKLLNQMKTYRKIIKAKLFEKGDEDGMETVGIIANFPPYSYNRPYIMTRVSRRHFGDFGDQYLCIDKDGCKFFVNKYIFEQTYELGINGVEPDFCKNLKPKVISPDRQVNAFLKLKIFLRSVINSYKK